MPALLFFGNKKQEKTGVL